MRLLVPFLAVVALSLPALASIKSELYAGVFVVDDPYLFCDLLQLTTDATTCNYQKGQTMPFSITMSGQTSAVVIDQQNIHAVKFDTIVANFNGQQAHYSPVNDTILILDHQQLHVVRMFRNQDKQYRSAGHFKLVRRKNISI